LIRVVVVDDHPAMRAGLRAVLDAESDLEATGEAGTGRDLAPLLERTAPDVVLMDFHLPDTDGFTLCSKLKRQPLSPRVIVYSAYADDGLAAAAAVAQADGLLPKSVSSSELCRVLRSNRPERPAVTIDDLEPLLDPDDRPLAEALLSGATPAEAARITGLERDKLGEHITRLLRRTLGPRAPMP
jgi:DNA-binding NarL/FixJ family response regulator